MRKNQELNVVSRSIYHVVQDEVTGFFYETRNTTGLVMVANPQEGWKFATAEAAITMAERLIFEEHRKYVARKVTEVIWMADDQFPKGWHPKPERKKKKYVKKKAKASLDQGSKAAVSPQEDNDPRNSENPFVREVARRRGRDDGGWIERRLKDEKFSDHTTCGNCGGKAYIHPASDTKDLWTCVKCGAIKNKKGKWIGGQVPAVVHAE